MPKNFETDLPLHRAVWFNDLPVLKQLVKPISRLRDEKSKKDQLERTDARGRTALMLAVVLKRTECVEFLLKHGADATAITKEFWSVVDEAVCTCDKRLLKMCLQYRDYQRYKHRSRVANEVVEKLSHTTDFYVEMKWEFHSWIPFVSKMCPSDTYTIYKRGRQVRVDTTLQGFDGGEWKRGRQTFIFKASDNNDGADFYIIDHELKTVFSEQIQKSAAESAADHPHRSGTNNIADGDNVDSAAANNEDIVDDEEADMLNYYAPSDDIVEQMIKSPITTLYVDLDKVAFERKQSGILIMKSDKSEEIGGYQCKVYTTTNVELITKTRMEHLDEQAKQEYKDRQSSNSTMVDSLLTWLQGSETKSKGTVGGGDLTPEKYFDPVTTEDFKKDVGLPKELSVRRRSFNANLSLCDDYPLSLIEQVSPIVDIMASTNAHFSRLKDFLTLQLPSGFPVKIEIPIFHVINAVVTFDNVHGEHTTVPGVTFLSDDKYKCCSIDDDLFNVPSDYSIQGMTADQFNLTENEEAALLQYAMRESRGTYASLNFSEEELALQRAIDASFRPFRTAQDSGDQEINANDYVESNLGQWVNVNTTPIDRNGVNSSIVNRSTVGFDADDDQLQLALSQSLKDEEERKKLAEEEDRDLERILAQSLKEQ